ncbi:hypothetical protein [Spiroplasma endosymbiont of Polydrusus pterygomalis]|uniref:hypothetical protein n=1 Tax=Spiroplasma endosymbiont of Polydrusus pterygomalis TaxID=3139327 RepID=UPI003CCB5E80
MALTKEQIEKLTPEQIQIFWPWQISELTTQQISWFIPQQISWLTAEQIQSFWSDQITWLTPEQIQTLTTAQIEAFTPEQIEAFTPQQIEALTPQQIETLTPEQIQAFWPWQISELTTQQDLKCEIKNLTKKIKLLEKQKAEKSWKITCFNIITFGIFKYHRNKKINEQIREMQIKSEELKIKITENTKVKSALKNKRLKVATKIINIFNNLLSDSTKQIINVQTEIYQEISQKLDAILEHQKFKTIDHTNSSSLLMSDSSGYNSDDEQQLPNTNSRLQNDKDSRLKQSLAVTCEKSNHNDDDGIEVIPEPEENDDDGIEVLSRSCFLDSLSINDLDQNLVNNSVDCSLLVQNTFSDNSDNKQLSNSSWQLFSRKNSVFSFQNKLSNIIEEDDDGIEVISESEEDDNMSEQKNILLEREDSPHDSEVEQSVFEQKSVNSDELVELFNCINKSNKFYQQNKI